MWFAKEIIIIFFNLPETFLTIKLTGFNFYCHQLLICWFKPDLQSVLLEKGEITATFSKIRKTFEKGRNVVKLLKFPEESRLYSIIYGTEH